MRRERWNYLQTSSHLFYSMFVLFQFLQRARQVLSCPACTTPSKLPNSNLMYLFEKNSL